MHHKKHMAAVLALAVFAGSHGVTGQGRGVPRGVAFNSSRDGNSEIYVMHWDGSEPVRVTDDPATDVDPAISPNGRDIIFTSNRAGNNDIFIADITGRNAVNLTNHAANDGWARWSPNGRHIVFHTNRDNGNFEIYVMNFDGSSPTRITDYPGIDQFPDWSPDGREIVFRRDVDIYVVELASGETRRLTETAPLLNQMATWSPNGKQLAFMSARHGYPSVFIMNADGSAQTNLTPKGAGDLDSQWVSRAPSWSTTGRQIYFMSSRPSTGLDTEVFIMNADGTGLMRLTNTVGVDGSPNAR
jgi:Tol biopolymer transport system component